MVLGYLFVIYVCLFSFSCKDPAEPLTLEQIADRCHCPEDVIFTFDLPCFLFLPLFVCHFLIRALCLNQIEMIYKIIQHMAANDRAIIAEGSCGSPRSVKVYLGECNVDDLWLPSRSSGLDLCKIWVVSWNKRNSTNGWAMHVSYVPLVSYLIVLWWAELPWLCTLGYSFCFLFKVPPNYKTREGHPAYVTSFERVSLPSIYSVKAPFRFNCLHSVESISMEVVKGAVKAVKPL